MFQYEYEKRPMSAHSCASQSTTTTDWSRSYPSGSRADIERARRPLPPRPCQTIPHKTSVPLKVWIIASASCFAVCAILVLATVVITKWGSEERYTTKELFAEQAEQIYNNYPEQSIDDESTSDETDTDIQIPILEKLSIFKNIVANRDKQKDLLTKPQIHPLHDTDTVHHPERKIEKKYQAKLPESIKIKISNVPHHEINEKIKTELLNENHRADHSRNIQTTVFNNPLQKKVLDNVLPEFKPMLPDVKEIKLPDKFIASFKNKDYEDYYNDENLYEDYMQSNTMTSYLIEKVQELHDWITTDPDFDKVKNSTKVLGKKTEFSQLLKALNESLLEGNVSIVMDKLRDVYFGDNYTNYISSNKKIILTNSTDMFSFGILTLDVMLLHNIQLMAWESQESARVKMLKDPDVFAFNALFMDPNKVEAKQYEIQHGNLPSKRQSLRQGDLDEFDLGKNLFENVLEVGMSAARAAIHLGRAYKNTRNIINQISNRDTGNIQAQISRNIDGNTHALNHLQSSYNKTDSVTSNNGNFYTELDCVWLLYCRNLAATAKLNAPFGTMARINGMALRMLSGELSADRALDTMLYEALAGWTDLKCNDMFPRCSKVNAANVVMDTILQPLKKAQTTNRGR